MDPSRGGREILDALSAVGKADDTDGAPRFCAIRQVSIHGVLVLQGRSTKGPAGTGGVSFGAGCSVRGPAPSRRERVGSWSSRWCSAAGAREMVRQAAAPRASVRKTARGGCSARGSGRDQNKRTKRRFLRLSRRPRAIQSRATPEGNELWGTAAGDALLAHIGVPRLIVKWSGTARSDASGRSVQAGSARCSSIAERRWRGKR